MVLTRAATMFLALWVFSTSAYGAAPEVCAGFVGEFNQGLYDNELGTGLAYIPSSETGYTAVEVTGSDGCDVLFVEREVPEVMVILVREPHQEPVYVASGMLPEDYSISSLNGRTVNSASFDTFVGGQSVIRVNDHFSRGGGGFASSGDGVYIFRIHKDELSLIFHYDEKAGGNYARGGDCSDNEESVSVLKIDAQHLSSIRPWPRLQLDTKTVSYTECYGNEHGATPSIADERVKMRQQTFVWDGVRYIEAALPK